MDINGKKYDVVIFGSGIAGSLTALPLAQEGFKVLVVELQGHPRFVIGESTTPTMSLHMRELSKKYNIPELYYITQYIEGKEPKGHCDFPKSHFWFSWNQEGKEHKLEDELMMEVLPPPIGPDVHMMRKITDEYMVSLYPKYGVDYVDFTSLEDYADNGDGYDLKLLHRKKNEKSAVKARYIVDATGHATFFAKKLGYLVEKEKMTHKTKTATIYNHFKLEDLPMIDNLLDGNSKYFRIKRHYGTQHHCFPGGWMWVIPFGRELVSVGLIFDRNHIESNMNLSPEEEFYSFIKKYPTIEKHLGKLVPMGTFVRKNPTQIQSTHVVGDRIILTPHASSFIDALYSTGMVQSASFIRNFIPVISKALRDNDFNKKHFQPIEDAFFRDIKRTDLLVSASLESFRHPETMKQMIKMWGCGAMYQVFSAMFVGGEGVDPRFPSLLGGNQKDYEEALLKIWDLLFRTRDADQHEVARQIQEIVDDHLLIYPDKNTYDYETRGVGTGKPCKMLSGPTVGAMIEKFIKNTSEYLPSDWEKGVETRKQAFFEMMNDYYGNLDTKNKDNEEFLKFTREDWYYSDKF